MGQLNGAGTATASGSISSKDTSFHLNMIKAGLLCLLYYIQVTSL
jgi:hypothetical protein